ncbi:hypothetical protein KQX54_019011 [Cotesia glomerata]|uniref:CWF21 domain-containing protein n=1 Tax=Cotesia glomerata TaxID=32391 RepID=A0AAV7J035_COTGL|nr:hypothetical protein KQX54_019011 [Cotesia glomerata]
MKAATILIISIVSSIQFYHCCGSADLDNPPEPRWNITLDNPTKKRYQRSVSYDASGEVRWDCSETAGTGYVPKTLGYLRSSSSSRPTVPCYIQGTSVRFQGKPVYIDGSTGYVDGAVCWVKGNTNERQGETCYARGTIVSHLYTSKVPELACIVQESIGFVMGTRYDREVPSYRQAESSDLVATACTMSTTYNYVLGTVLYEEGTSGYVNGSSCWVRGLRHDGLGRTCNIPGTAGDLVGIDGRVSGTACYLQFSTTYVLGTRYYQLPSCLNCNEQVSSSFPGTNVPGTNFPETNVPGTNFPGTNVPGTNFPGTNVPGTNRDQKINRNVPGTNRNEQVNSNFPGTHRDQQVNSNVPGTNRDEQVNSNVLGTNHDHGRTEQVQRTGVDTQRTISENHALGDASSHIPRSNDFTIKFVGHEITASGEHVLTFCYLRPSFLQIGSPHFVEGSSGYVNGSTCWIEGTVSFTQPNHCYVEGSIKTLQRHKVSKVVCFVSSTSGYDLDNNYVIGTRSYYLHPCKVEGVTDYFDGTITYFRGSRGFVYRNTCWVEGVRKNGGVCHRRGVTYYIKEDSENDHRACYFTVKYAFVMDDRYHELNRNSRVEEDSFRHTGISLHENSWDSGHSESRSFINDWEIKTIIDEIHNHGSIHNQDHGTVNHGLIHNQDHGTIHNQDDGTVNHGLIHNQDDGTIHNQDDGTVNHGLIHNQDDGTVNHGKIHNQDQRTVNHGLIHNQDHGTIHNQDDGTVNHGLIHNQDDGTVNHGTIHNQDQRTVNHGLIHNQDYGTIHNQDDGTVNHGLIHNQDHGTIHNQDDGTVNHGTIHNQDQRTVNHGLIHNQDYGTIHNQDDGTVNHGLIHNQDDGTVNHGLIHNQDDGTVNHGTIHNQDHGTVLEENNRRIDTHGSENERDSNSLFESRQNTNDFQQEDYNQYEENVNNNYGSSENSITNWSISNHDEEQSQEETNRFDEQYRRNYIMQGKDQSRETERNRDFENNIYQQYETAWTYDPNFLKKIPPLTSNMYNGIGLQTPRGSGTNGHVQRNWAVVRKTKDKVDYKSDDKLDSINKQPNKDILDHVRKRKIELKVAEFADNLEDKGYTASEIKEKISQYREILMDNGSKPPPVPTDEFGRVM